MESIWNSNLQRPDLESNKLNCLNYFQIYRKTEYYLRRKCKNFDCIVSYFVYLYRPSYRLRSEREKLWRSVIIHEIWDEKFQNCDKNIAFIRKKIIFYFYTNFLNINNAFYLLSFSNLKLKPLAVKFSELVFWIKAKKTIKLESIRVDVMKNVP